jgi:predicted peptidase
MKKILSFLVAAFAALAAASAQETYESKTFVSSDGHSLNYRELTPLKTEAKKKYPLVIFLHGAGERGDDNEKQLVHGSQMFLNPYNRETYPAYVLFPQCPESSFWAFPDIPKYAGRGTAGQMAPAFKAVKEMIDEYIAMPTVDPSRVYILGLSMGGMGTFDMVSRFPEIFAAAIPICGAASPGKIKAAKNVKFRIYHGDADPTVPVECSRAAYRELKEAGADVEYFEFAGCGHASWNPAFNQPDFMEWIFAQKKSRRARK